MLFVSLTRPPHLSRLSTMQTICVSFYDFERDTLLPHCVRQCWRAELCPIILDDVQQGLFGTRRYNLWSYTAVYNLNLGEGSLCRIRANLQSLAASDERRTSSLRELLANANIWLSFEAIRSNEVLTYSMFRRPHFPNVLNNLHTHSSRWI
jgi:hypothetical protein